MSSIVSPCNGEGSLDQAVARWKNGDCQTSYINLLSWTSNGSPGYNIEAQPEARSSFNGAFDQMLESQGGEIRDIKESEHTDLQENMYNMCKNLPQACVLALDNYCSSLTREEISSSNAKIRFCGCYGPDVDEEDMANSEIDKECDPLCNRGDTISLPVEGSLNEKACDNTVCVIDNVTITAAGGSGNVTFNQVCTGCTKSQPCRCIINNVNVSEMNGNPRLEMSEGCNSFTSVCLDNDREINCSEIFEDEETSAEETNRIIQIMIIITFLILIILLLIAIFL